MPRIYRAPACRRLGLWLGLFLLTANTANADLSVSNIGLYDGSSAPTAYITFTGSNGSVDVYADPQTATNSNWQSNGSPIPLYCIDTVHENYLGSSYTVKLETTPYFSTTPANGMTAAAAANEVAWALENAANTVNSRAATQLFIWSIVDKNFSVTNWNGNNSTSPGLLQGDFNALVALTGYNPSTNYLPGAVFLGANHDGVLYQDLAYAQPGVSIQSTPEPSALLIAGWGALGLGGYAWRRQLRIKRA
jgi:MYXO-CTERM domain-containing protein